MKFVIGSGQSLSVGGPGMEGGDMTLNDRVKIWSDDGWITADPDKHPFKQAADGAVYNNTLWQFCKQLQEKTGETVYFVLSGKGGTPISEWADGHEQWEQLDNRAHAAMNSPELARVHGPDYFLWVHGGADRNNEHYGSDFLDMRRRAIDSGWLEDDTRVIFGQPKSYGESKEAIFNMIGSGDYPWLHEADNTDVQYNTYNDHPTGKGCMEYDRAFYEAAVEQAQTLKHQFGATHFDFGTWQDDMMFITQDHMMIRSGDGNDTVDISGDSSVVFGGLGRDTFTLHDFGDTIIRGSYGWDTLVLKLHEGQSYERDGDVITVDNATVKLDDIDAVKVVWDV